MNMFKKMPGPLTPGRIILVSTSRGLWHGFGIGAACGAATYLLWSVVMSIAAAADAGFSGLPSLDLLVYLPVAIVIGAIVGAAFGVVLGALIGVAAASTATSGDIPHRAGMVGFVGALAFTAFWALIGGALVVVAFIFVPVIIWAAFHHGLYLERRVSGGAQAGAAS